MYSTNRHDPLSLDQLKHVIVLALLSTIVVTAPTRAQEAISQIRVAPRVLAAQLLENEDTDGDHKITVHDPFVRGTDRGDKVFWFASSNDRRYQVAGVARLANLLQELTLLGERDSAWLMVDRIVERPAEHVSRSIRGLFWNDLTRTIDGQGLPRLFDDEKTTNADGHRYVYVPASDAFALE